MYDIKIAIRPNDTKANKEQGFKATKTSTVQVDSLDFMNDYPDRYNLTYGYYGIDHFVQTNPRYISTVTFTIWGDTYNDALDKVEEFKKKYNSEYKPIRDLVEEAAEEGNYDYYTIEMIDTRQNLEPITYRRARVKDTEFIYDLPEKSDTYGTRNNGWWGYDGENKFTVFISPNEVDDFVKNYGVEFSSKHNSVLRDKYKDGIRFF